MMRSGPAFLFLALFIVTMPQFVRGVGMQADDMCVPVKQECMCGMFKNPKTGACDIPGNKFMCQCFDNTNGFTTTGICVANFKCQAMGTSDGKGPDQGMSKLGEMLGKLMEALKKQGGGGEGGGGGQGQQPPFGSQGCTTYQPTNDENLAKTNPCYYYLPNISGQIGTDGNQNISDLINSLTERGNSIADLLNNAASSTGTSVDTNTGSVTNTSTGAGTSVNTNVSTVVFTSPVNELGNTGTVRGSGGKGFSSAGPAGSVNAGTSVEAGASLNFSSPQDIVQSIIAKNLPPGTYGDVKILENGTTIIAGIKEKNSEVAGFFGLSGGTQKESVLGRLCTRRPWAKNFLSYIIPASFFDGLCAWRGYEVGPKQQAPITSTGALKTQTKAGETKASATPATSTPAIPPKVDIWASPETVPLGARTSIFWSAQGVLRCTETSEDGAFTQNSLKGGASTVPLTAATKFTITCDVSDGTKISDSVTVLIAI